MTYRIHCILAVLCTMTLNATVVSLSPPILSRDTILQELVCTRPVRAGKFHITLDQRNGKTIVHCYGHGGSGWTFLFGSVNRAIELFENTGPSKDIPIRIIGSGCMGLTTAIELHRLGYKIAGISTKSMYDIPSWRAGGYLALTSKEEHVKELFLNSFLTYQMIDRGEHPYISQDAVRYLPIYCKDDMKSGVEDLESLGMIPPREKVSLSFGNGIVRDGFAKYMSYFMNTSVLMRQLTAEVVKRAISIELQEVHSFDELSEEVIFNCSGLGARELNEDANMVPVRGHLFTLKESAGNAHMDYMLCTKVNNENIYLFPKNLSVTSENPEGISCAGVLGGTYIPNADQLSIDEQAKLDKEEFSRMFARCVEFFSTKPYFEEEVSYGNSEILLSGTLTLPNTTGPFPAVILIHGSSALDRDETMLGHKPFLVLADHFTRQGIAVLRFDKRGVGKSTGIFENATIEDFGDDVAKGIEYLKSRPEINQIGLVGHSEGAMVAPMLAAKSSDVGFIVMMAGPGVNGVENFCEQGKLLYRAYGIDEEMIAIDTQVRKIVGETVKKETNRDVAKEQINEALAKLLSGLTEDQKTWVKTIASEDVINRFNSPWGHFFFSYDPATVLRRITIPALVLNGELDLVVSPKQNLPVIDQALKEAGNEEYTIMELPKLNHAFQTCVRGSWDEYEQIEETIAPSALNIMTDWILEKTVKQ